MRVRTAEVAVQSGMPACGRGARHASETPRIAFAPSASLLGVPSRSISARSTVALFERVDAGGSAIYRPMRGRFALYTEAVREIAERHGTRLVDFWRMREYRDFGYWDTDRMHLGPAGHQRMAMAVLDALGVPHTLEALPPTVRPELSRARDAREERGVGPHARRPVGPPPRHRPFVGRRHLPEATGAGPDLNRLAGFG